MPRGSSSFGSGAIASSSVINSFEMYLNDDVSIVNSAAVQVKTSDTFASSYTPTENGLYDRRLGPIAQYYPCITCGYDKTHCPGHQGYYDMKEYTVTQPLIIDEIHKWLKIVCLKCGYPNYDKTKLEQISISKRLQTLSETRVGNEECKNKDCKAKHPVIKRHDKFPYIFVAKTGKEEVYLYPEDVKKVFEKISDDVVKDMGRSVKSHPRKFYVTKIVIPPITIRPYYRTTSGAKQTSKQESGLEFIKAIIKKAQLVTQSEEERKSHSLFIQRCFFDMIRGGKQGGSRDQNIIGGKTNSSILSTHSGKKGTIRNQTLGHRCLNSSRSTISGNPNLKLTQVGIPIYVQRILYIPEVVQNFNKKKLTSYLMAGRCTAIIKAGTDKEKIITDKNRSSLVLENGDIVHRMIEYGDIVNFNRQPSLKETAIGSHEAVPFQTEDINTFQMNVGVCKNYNADFDGDQMNLKVLKTLLSIVEAMFISSPNRWFLSTQNSIANNGQEQDAIIGSALLTKNGVVLDKLHAMRCFSTCDLDRLPVFSKNQYTGREVLSLLLSMTPINYKGKATFYNETYASYIPYDKDEIFIEIVDGVIKSGVLDKKAIGAGANTIFHLIAKKYGSEAAMSAVYYYQQVCIGYLAFRGFTMSLDDIIPPKEQAEHIRKIVAEKVLKSEIYAQQYIKGEVFPPLGRTPKQHYEMQQINLLSHDDSMLPHILSSVTKDYNGFFQMIRHGSKGSQMNLFAILGYVGQVMMEGSRLPENFSPHRSSAYSPRYDLHPFSRGFVIGNYSTGVSPVENSRISQEARAQLIQKSQSTALSGTVLRAHVKNLESAIVDYFRRVNKSHMTIQYLYGDDGMDSRHLIKQQIPTVFLSDDKIRERYPKSMKEEITALIQDRDLYRKMAINMDIINMLQMSDMVYVPVNINSIVHDVIQASNKKVASGSELRVDLPLMRKMVKEFVDNLGYVYQNRSMRSQQGYLPEYMKSGTFLLSMIIRTELTTDNLEKIDIEALKYLFDKLYHEIVICMVNPGLCAGILAAQSFGEPLVQWMLDSLHGGSGDAKASLTRGKSVLSARESPNEMRTMIVRLIEPHCFDNKTVKKVAMDLIGLSVNNFVKSWQIFMEKFGEPVHPKWRHEKADIDKFASAFNTAGMDNSSSTIKGLSNWCIRIEFNIQNMIVKNIQLEDIVKAVYEKFRNIYIVHTSERHQVVYMRIYIKDIELSRIGNQNIQKYIVEGLFPAIMSTYVRGIHNILDASVKKKDKYKISDDGSMIKQTEYIIKTVGSNYIGLANYYIQEDSIIDYSTSSSSEVLETEKIFGIEAARSKIIEQINDSMSGRAPVYPHLSIYADTMCWSHKVVSIEKASLLESDKTLLRATAYGATKVLTNAVKVGVHENVRNSISANFILGTIPRVGTHYFDTLIDEEFIKDKMKSTTDILDEVFNV